MQLCLVITALVTTWMIIFRTGNAVCTQDNFCSLFCSRVCREKLNIEWNPFPRCLAGSCGCYASCENDTNICTELLCLQNNSKVTLVPPRGRGTTSLPANFTLTPTKSTPHKVTSLQSTILLLITMAFVAVLVYGFCFYIRQRYGQYLEQVSPVAHTSASHEEGQMAQDLPPSYSQALIHSRPVTSVLGRSISIINPSRSVIAQRRGLFAREESTMSTGSGVLPPYQEAIKLNPASLTRYISRSSPTDSHRLQEAENNETGINLAASNTNGVVLEVSEDTSQNTMRTTRSSVDTPADTNCGNNLPHGITFPPIRPHLRDEHASSCPVISSPLRQTEDFRDTDSASNVTFTVPHCDSQKF